MEDNRTVITWDSTRTDWLTKAVKAGPAEYGEVLLQGVMEVTRDLTDMINRQNVRDLPLIIASMHILERGLRASPIWTPYTNSMIAMIEQLFGTETQTGAVAIKRETLEKIEEWKRRKEKA